MSFKERSVIGGCKHRLVIVVYNEKKINIKELGKMTYPEERETQILIDHYDMTFIVETNNRTISKRILKKGFKPEGMENMTIDEILARDERILFRFSDLSSLKQFAVSSIFKAS